MTIEDIKFFEHFLTAKLGERRGGCWRCPRVEHRNESVYVRDDCPDGRLRWGCHRCGLAAGGDEFDLMRMVGVRGYGAQLCELARLRIEYGAGHVKATASHSSPVGSRAADRTARDVQEAWANLADADRKELAALLDRGAERETMRQVGNVSAVAARAGVSVEELARECAEFEEFVERTDLIHIAECIERDCDAAVCRAARGRPLSEQQVEAFAGAWWFADPSLLGKPTRYEQVRRWLPQHYRNAV